MHGYIVFHRMILTITTTHTVFLRGTKRKQKQITLSQLYRKKNSVNEKT